MTAEWCSICQIVDTEIFKNLDIMKHLISFCTLAKVDCTMIDPEKEKIIKNSEERIKKEISKYVNANQTLIFNERFGKEFSSMNFQAITFKNIIKWILL